MADVLEQMELPPIFCPLEPATNPARAAVERRAVAWIDRMGLCADPRERAWVVGTDSADFYARFAPEADEDRLLAAALWVYWGFAFDDARCDAGHYSDRPAEFVPMAFRLQRALERPVPADADDVYARALRDIGERFRRTGTAVQFQRFAAAHRAWLTGVAWQISNQARGHMPDLDDYLTMRLHSAGGEPTFAMLELADGPEVPAAEMESPAVRALTEMAILVAALDNDRHSLRKELGRRHADQNIYTVLLHHRRCSLAEAVRTATGLRDRVLLRFLRLRERVAPRLSTAGRRYVDGLAHGIRGNAEWGLRVPRYVSRGADPGATDTSPVTWAERPCDDSGEPIPLPTVVWWWDV
ncbi:MAG TPA: terpene synthase family protein [Thermomonospora sp.]|nr:terpene synthase family protein [Thermomonospora sp.]